MNSHFFIDRPIFATVISAVITLIGGIALWSLPLAQYPRITPPSIQVSISYPGANAQTVADTVGAPIEQQVTGVPGMLYMQSQSGNDGSYSLSVTFDVATDLNTALVMVQNRVTLAMPLLPTPVQNQGIQIRKRTPDMLLIVSMYSPEQKYDGLYMSNYALINLRDELLRVDGVADIRISGQRDYSLRIWLDPLRLASLNLSPVDVANALRSQSTESALGQIGQPPSNAGQMIQLPIDALGRLSEPEDFDEIVIKVGPTARIGAAAGTTTAVRRALDLPGAGMVDPLEGSMSPGDLGESIGTTAQMTSTTSSGSGASAGAGMGPQSIATALSDMSTLISRVGGQPGVATVGGATSIGGATTASGAATTVTTAVGTGGGALTTPVGATGSEVGTANFGVSDPGNDPGLTSLSINAQLTNPGGGGGGGTSAGPQPLSTGVVRLRDVARVEMGAADYNQGYMFDGQPAIGLMLYQLPGTNAIEVSQRVHKKMKELGASFPEGLVYNIAYDTTQFIEESIQDVVDTLLLAVLLVGIVVLCFLQSWRAVLIPMAAVPVAIIGTFSVMAVAGFSLNNISLFGLVLSIGIVVDDAIVVVENVERWLEEGMTPRDAVRRAMTEVTGPIIAMALVLCTVFVPCAFISGITGRFFREFAVTIAVSTMFSAINSLTLSPALAALILRRRDQHNDVVTKSLDVSLGWFFRSFNWCFKLGTAIYDWTIGVMLRLSPLVLVAYAALLVVTVLMFRGAPRGFVPQQDQGRIMISAQLPDSASLERTRDIMKDVERITRETPGIAHTVTILGMAFVQQSNGSNFGSIFATLDPFSERRSPGLKDTAIIAKLKKRWAEEIRDATVTAASASPIPGLSVAGGFKLMVKDQAGIGLATLQKQTDALVKALSETPGLTGVSTNFRSKTPQLFMDINRDKIETLGVNFGDAFQTLQIYLGSSYVNDFNKYGRHWHVTLQADGRYRTQSDSLNLFQVRNRSGQMVSLSSLVDIRDTVGPLSLNRFNLATAAPITGSIVNGFSSSDVIDATEKEAVAILPRTMRAEWTDLMFLQIKEGNTTITVFSLAVFCVFLTLAALYESWSLPLAVILVVPLCVLCSLIGVLWTGTSVNIFVQIGLVVLVGLACKNAILIVEFAKELAVTGKPLAEATREASRLRLRPILMTSLAFIFGVLPLVFANGAGAEMRRSLGTAVFSGMVGVTFFGIFLTPVFFYVLRGAGELRMFAGPTAFRIWSYAGGVSLGAIAGFLLSRLGVVDPVWAPIVGAAAGATTVAAALGISGRPIKPWKSA